MHKRVVQASLQLRVELVVGEVVLLFPVCQLLHMQLWEQGSKTENGSRCVVVKQRQSADLLLFKGMNRKRSSKSHKKPLGCFFLVVFKFLLASKPNKATLWCIAFEIMSCYSIAHITVHWLSHLLISVSQFPHLLSRVSLPVLQRKL